MITIAAALAEIRGRIDAALQRADRPAGSARLVAVSKKVSPERIREALAAGQRELGESYGQELRDKIKEFEGDREPSPIWHYIGPLQSNKVKYVAGRVQLIHSIDGPEILTEVDRHVGKLAALGQLAPDTAQDCLVQVNVAGESRKHGVSPDSLAEVLDLFSELQHVRCRGLMLIPPLDEAPEAARPLFAQLARLRALHSEKRRRGVELIELSMGMSGDFEIAVEEGATLVRVGSAIFGARS